MDSSSTSHIMNSKNNVEFSSTALDKKYNETILPMSDYSTIPMTAQDCSTSTATTAKTAQQQIPQSSELLGFNNATCLQKSSFADMSIPIAASSMCSQTAPVFEQLSKKSTVGNNQEKSIDPSHLSKLEKSELSHIEPSQITKCDNLNTCTQNNLKSSIPATFDSKIDFPRSIDAKKQLESFNESPGLFYNISPSNSFDKNSFLFDKKHASNYKNPVNRDIQGTARTRDNQALFAKVVESDNRFKTPEIQSNPFYQACYSNIDNSQNRSNHHMNQNKHKINLKQYNANTRCNKKSSRMGDYYFEKHSPSATDTGVFSSLKTEPFKQLDLHELIKHISFVKHEKDDTVYDLSNLFNQMNLQLKHSAKEIKSMSTCIQQLETALQATRSEYKRDTVSHLSSSQERLLELHSMHAKVESLESALHSQLKTTTRLTNSATRELEFELYKKKLDVKYLENAAQNQREREQHFAKENYLAISRYIQRLKEIQKENERQKQVQNIKALYAMTSKQTGSTQNLVHQLTVRLRESQNK
ncbi:hypothetical protein QVD99_008263 [Batrachochytrium dendrobatidis]|nr:hypothetical protein QVD99_008263 [Batrachochytrium dendrobatidis]